MNWNGQNDTIECLESVLGATYENLRIVVVDNGSTDGSVPAVSRWLETKGYHTLHIGHKGSQIGANSFMLSSVDTVSRSEALNEVRCIGNLLQPSDVILVRNDKNLGYALGNNVGMSFAVEIIKSEFVFLLNNDTVVDRLALTELMRAAESCKGSDIFGPMVCSYDSPDLVQPNCGRMSMWLGRRFPIIPDRGGLSDCCWTEVER